MDDDQYQQLSAGWASYQYQEQSRQEQQRQQMEQAARGASYVPDSARGGCGAVLGWLFWGGVIFLVLGALLGQGGGGSSTGPASGVPSAQSAGGWYPQTRTRYLSEAEVAAWPPAQVQAALNEMYAWHGYPFGDGDWGRHFARFGWYRPVPGRTMSAVEAAFTDVERHNFRLLVAARQRLSFIGPPISRLAFLVPPSEPTIIGETVAAALPAQCGGAPTRVDVTGAKGRRSCLRRPPAALASRPRSGSARKETDRWPVT